MKVKLSDIKLTNLNNNCISLVLKFSRVLYAHDGTTMRVNEKQVVRRLFSIAKTTDNIELKRLAARLKREIRICFLGEYDEETSFQLYEVVGQSDSSANDASKHQLAS